MDDGGERFTRAVGLACHDLRTPLATIAGFAKTMLDAGELPEREQRFVSMIDQAASQVGMLLDQLTLAARLRSGRYAPALEPADTLELALAAAGDDERISVAGDGTAIETDPAVVRRSLEALTLAALRYGDRGAVSWEVAGRELILLPLPAAAAVVLDGASSGDLGALVAAMAIERLGGRLAVEGEALRVSL